MGVADDAGRDDEGLPLRERSLAREAVGFGELVSFAAGRASARELGPVDPIQAEKAAAAADLSPQRSPAIELSVSPPRTL